MCSDHVEFCRVSGIPGLSASAFTSLFLSYSPWRSWQSSPSHLRFAAQTRLQMCILRVLRQILSASLLLPALLLSLCHPLAAMWLAFSLRLSISDCFRSTGANLHQFSVKPVRFRTTFFSNHTDSAPACRVSFPGEPTCTESAPVCSQTGPVLHRLLLQPHRFCTGLPGKPSPEANVYQFPVQPLRSCTTLA